MPLEDWLDFSDPQNTKLAIRNYKLDDNTIKAIACILPFMLDVNEIEFRSNNITDIISGALVFAIFANPNIKRITIPYNHLRGVFARTLQKLIKLAPDKL